jgi:DNA-binding SARP family transcriptional activator
MGAFELVLEDRPVDPTAKAPHRCLTFLKALAALGGHNVHQDTLTDIVWPDTDGDAGRRSFDTTLHRLRHLLGHHDALTLHNGLLSLNRAYCWLDAWALEALCEQLSRALAAGTAIDYGSVERLLALYRGRLLELEPDQGWLVIRRQRLSQRFVRTITALGRHYEERGAWNNAIACYRESLAGETSNEILYQRLMHLYIRHGRYAEAVGIYRQCRTVLATLHLIPSVETERILVGIPP